MKIAALTRFKQGDLYALLKKLGWSQRELGKRAGIHPTEIGSILNLRRRPSQVHADRIQSAFAEAGEYVDVIKLFPETFVGFEKSPVVEQFQDVDVAQLDYFAQHQQHMLMDAEPPIAAESLADKDVLRFAMESLTERERDVITHVIMNGATKTEAGKLLNIGASRVDQIHDRALRKMRRRLTMGQHKTPFERNLDSPHNKHSEEETDEFERAGWDPCFQRPSL